MNVYIVLNIRLAYITIFVINGQIMPYLLNLKNIRKKNLLQKTKQKNFIGTQNLCNVFKFVSASENPYSKANSM